MVQPLFSDVGRRAPTPRDTQYKAFRALIAIGLLASAVTFLWEWAATTRPMTTVEVDLGLKPASGL